MVRQNLINNNKKTVGGNCTNTSPNVLNNTENSRNRIKLFHLNAQSIKSRNHIIQIRELVVNKNMDILAISESWLNSSTSNAEVEIIGYKLHRLDRLHKKGGGVCIYVRNNFKTKRLKDYPIYQHLVSTNYGYRYK